VIWLTLLPSGRRSDRNNGNASNNYFSQPNFRGPASVSALAIMAISHQPTLLPLRSFSDLPTAHAVCTAAATFDGLQVRRSIAYLSARDSSASPAAGFSLARHALNSEEAARLAAVERSE
jgi:hypothetical protein